MTSRALAAFLVAPFLLATAGCASSEVLGRFEAAESCPANRITVRLVGKVRPKPVPSPPPEIAADPERAAIYYEQQRNGQPNVGQRIFVAEGCGHRRTYLCDFQDEEGYHWCEEQTPVVPPVVAKGPAQRG